MCQLIFFDSLKYEKKFLIQFLTKTTCLEIRSIRRKSELNEVIV